MADKERMPLAVGSRYPDYESFQQAVLDYSMENNCVYTTVKSNRLSSAVKSKKPRLSLSHKDHVPKPLDPRLVMRYLKLGCKHHGVVRSMSKGIRPNQKTYKCGCESTIDVFADRFTSELVVKAFNEEHNHLTGPEQAQYYPERRRLSQAETKDLQQQILNTEIKPSSIQEYIHETTKKPITTKDIYNLRKKFHVSSMATKRIAKEEPEEHIEEEVGYLDEETGLYAPLEAEEYVYGDEPGFLSHEVEVESEEPHSSPIAIEKVNEAWKCVYMVLEEENKKVKADNARLTDELKKLRSAAGICSRCAQQDKTPKKKIDFRVTAVAATPTRARFHPTPCTKLTYSVHDYAKTPPAQTIPNVEKETTTEFEEVTEKNVDKANTPKLDEATVTMED